MPTQWRDNKRNEKYDIHIIFFISNNGIVTEMGAIRKRNENMTNVSYFTSQTTEYHALGDTHKQNKNKNGNEIFSH